mgnify:FL=1
MSLRSLQARHAQQILGNANGVAEPVTYRFKSGAADRTFNAVVKRLFLEPSTPQSRPVKVRRCDVEIVRDQTVGVLATSPGDAIILPVGIGEVAAVCRITRVLSQDHAQIVVQVTEQ